jgi:hypothetical protein
MLYLYSQIEFKRIKATEWKGKLIIKVRGTGGEKI